ncbi:MAG: hypothetical protein KA801_04640 [Syntrophorhabdaceae bacterium]|nr:hypothetical protein [Syntrophorhabdaceae bacterium]
MANKGRSSAYVDYNILDLIAMAGVDDRALLAEWNALRSIWQRYKEDRLCLVTSVDEMELDFVIQMNRGGLCVTDTFQITDNIDNFECWDGADCNDTSHWRAIVDLYDQLEIISGHDDMVGEHEHPLMCEHVSAVLCDELKKAKDAVKTAAYDEETAILRDCAAALHNVYNMQLWADLKHIQYELNWKVLKEVLPKYARSAALNGDDAAFNKNLLGLLNRLVNIGKKSCPRLPMADRHIDFVLDIVRKKYCQETVDRHVAHIAHSLRNGIDYHLTTNGDIIEKFAAGKDMLQSLIGGPTIHLEVLLPTELEKRLK